MNGCTVKLLRTCPCAAPPIRQILFARTPITHGPGITRPTAVGPRPHCPVRSTSLVAVGKEKTGPSPQTNFDGLELVTYACSWISAMPDDRTPKTGRKPRSVKMLSGRGTLVNGTIVLDTISQRLPIGTGNTGCISSNFKSVGRGFETRPGHWRKSLDD